MVVLSKAADIDLVCDSVLTLVRACSTGTREHRNAQYTTCGDGAYMDVQLATRLSKVRLELDTPAHFQ